MNDDLTNQPLNEEELQEAIREATDAVNRLEVEERAERVRQGRRFVTAAIVGFLLTVAAIWTGIAGKQAIDHANQQTASRIKFSCLQQVKDRKELIADLKSGHRVLIKAIVGNQPITHELQERIDNYYRDSDHDIDVHLRIRDCSPEGIEAYLKGEAGYLP